MLAYHLSAYGPGWLLKEHPPNLDCLKWMGGCHSATSSNAPGDESTIIVKRGMQLETSGAYPKVVDIFNVPFCPQKGFDKLCYCSASLRSAD
jgi:hypothetical protein